MNVTENDVARPSDAELRALDTEGYVVMANVLDAATLGRLRGHLDGLFDREGADAGREFRHLVLPDDRAGAAYLGNLLAKDDLFRACVSAPRVLGIVRHLLGDKLAIHAVNARNPHHRGGQQVLHAHPGLVNTLWLLDDMTPENGPTRVLRGSHRSTLDMDLEDEVEQTDLRPDERLITATAGAVVVLTERVLHAGTVNRSGAPRRVVTTAFSRPDVPPQYW